MHDYITPSTHASSYIIDDPATLSIFWQTFYGPFFCPFCHWVRDQNRDKEARWHVFDARNKIIGLHIQFHPDGETRDTLPPLGGAREGKEPKSDSIVCLPT